MTDEIIHNLMAQERENNDRIKASTRAIYSTFTKRTINRSNRQYLV